MMVFDQKLEETRMGDAIEQLLFLMGLALAHSVDEGLDTAQLAKPNVELFRPQAVFEVAGQQHRLAHPDLNNEQALNAIRAAFAMHYRDFETYVVVEPDESNQASANTTRSATIIAGSIRPSIEIHAQLELENEDNSLTKIELVHATGVQISGQSLDPWQHEIILNQMKKGYESERGEDLELPKLIVGPMQSSKTDSSRTRL